MRKEDKIKKLIDYLEEVNDIVHNKHHELAQKHNLTVEQFHLLLHIQRKNVQPTVSEIANSFKNAQNTMSEKIGRLEEKGLIEKVKDSKDKRISRVSISDTGKNLIDVICNEASNQFLFNSIDKMSENQLDIFLQSFNELTLKLKSE